MPQFEDKFQEGTIITFQKKFNPTAPTIYTYAAIKVHNRWYTTGGKSYTWEILLTFLSEGVTQVRVVTAMDDQSELFGINNG